MDINNHRRYILKTNVLLTTVQDAAHTEPVKRKPKDKRLNGDLSVSHAKRKEAGKVLIAGHFDPEVRSALFLIQAKKSHIGRSLQDMLGEAINDYCAKYHVPQPYKPAS